jgi:NADH-quinone oxidoreductase subunit L
VISASAGSAQALAWLIPALPAGAFALIGLFTFRWKQLSAALNIGSIAVATVLAYGIFLEALGGASSTNTNLSWIKVGPGNDFVFGWQVDPLTAVMLLVVTTVSLLVQIYSLGYMRGDPGYSRYFAYMAMFTAAMLGLVLANNLLTIYIFWEGVGLGSYLLIGFWYARPEAAAAAKKAFITTRLGDFGFLIGILLIWVTAGTLDFSALAEKIEHQQIGGPVLTVAALLVFCGAVGKSAQFPLHVWLPDAMEGPTPVSALIHAATMVAAGVYLVARSFFLFEASPQAMFVVAAVGGFTAIFAATMGLVSNDIKRVLAYSTVSQLGYMMLGLGSGVVAAGIFHLLTHAFFKALLFLTAGSVIHAVHSNELSDMGGLRRAMPITFITMVIGAVSLGGIFPLSGFWSKDTVLAAVWNQATGGGGPGYLVLLFFALITVFLTAFYMFRVIFRAFFGDYLGHGHPHESPPVMTVPLLILAVPSVLVGLWGSPLLGEGFQRFVEGPAFHHEELNLQMAVLSTILGLAGIGLAYLMYVKRTVPAEAMARRLQPAYTTLKNRYYLDELYEAMIDRGVLAFSRFLAFFVDPRVIDGAVNGSGRLAVRTSTVVRRIQTGRVQSYAMAVFAGLALISVFAIVARAMVR